ncbi:MAG: hypothetical protein CW338_05635, partial [Clostridiales bacterium]|nr:hypothetical protein [Clostridiales bacterium]
MKTYQFTYKSKEGLSQTFTRISSGRKRTDAEGIFFYITWTHDAQDLLGDVTKLIQYHFPGSVYYGAEASGNIADGSLSLGIHITCFIFEEPDSRVELVRVEEGGTPRSLDDLWDICRKRDGLRAVELIPSSTYLEKLNIDNNVPGLPGDIVIFGGTSICYNDPAITAGVMAAGLETVRQGMIAILYYGSELHISSAYVLGWKGLGRYMRVTGCEGKIIHDIDGHPAFSIYEKYLNLTLEDNDALVFPLIVEEDGVEFIRTPQAFLPDRSIQTLTAIPEDAHVRIAYGDRNAILSGINEKMPDIAAFAPQVLKVYSCAVRRFFWGDDDISRETVPLQQIAPVCGFYTGGELLRLGSKLRVLNSTLVLISLREGAADTSSVSLTGDEKRTDKSLVSRLSFFTEQIAKEQTIQYAHEKLRGDVADYLANHDEDPMELLRTFAEPMRQLFKADQMVFHGLDGSSVISGSPLAENIWSSPDVYCKDCPYSDPHCPVYTDGVADIGNCRSENCGLRTHPECPVRSEFNQIVLCNNEPVGSVSVRYITQIHEFSTLERETLIELNRVLSLAISRYKASQENLAYLKQKEEERRQKEAGMNSTLDSLSDNYDLVLFVNQTQDLVVRVKGTDEFTSVIDALPSGLSGIKKLYEFFRIIVFPEDYDDFIKYTSSERVDRYAAMGKSCSYNF